MSSKRKLPQRFCLFQTYDCSDSSASKWCPALDGSIKITFESSFTSSANIHLKVTQTDDSEYFIDFFKGCGSFYRVIRQVLKIGILLSIFQP